MLLLLLLSSSCATQTYVMHNHDDHHPAYFYHEHIEGEDEELNWEKHDKSSIYPDYNSLYFNHCHSYYSDNYFFCH